MSWFVCGRVGFPVADEDARERIARCARMQALRSGACVMFECAIVQKVVFEIVGDYERAANRPPFLMAGSPLSDVSERLMGFGLESTRVLSVDSIERELLREWARWDEDDLGQFSFCLVIPSGDPG